MNTLNLENINKQAPYKVTVDTDFPHLFYFHTDYEVDYEICIKSNDTFIPSGAYALDIRNKCNQPSPGDPKFRQTLMAIVEEFFRLNNDVMLYVTETPISLRPSQSSTRQFHSYSTRPRNLPKRVQRCLTPL